MSSKKKKRNLEENVQKAEISGNQHFLFFQQCFQHDQKYVLTLVVESQCHAKRVKSQPTDQMTLFHLSYLLPHKISFITIES